MYRLIYKSRSPSAIDWDTVRNILHTSEQHNKEDQLSGVLLASRTHFMQVIEGPFENVNSTFMRIVKDPRHNDIQLVSFGIIDARIFTDWAMRGIGIFDLNKDLEDRLIEKYGEEDGGLHFPLEGWMALAMIHDINMISDLPEWKQ